jgi:hypothetical protein
MKKIVQIVSLRSLNLVIINFLFTLIFKVCSTNGSTRVDISNQLNDESEFIIELIARERERAR